MVKDDGRGLDKSKIYKRQKKRFGFKNEDEMTDREILTLS